MKPPLTRTTRNSPAIHVADPVEFARRRGGRMNHLLRQLAEVDDRGLKALGDRLALATTRVFSATWVQLVSLDEAGSTAHWGRVAQADVQAWASVGRSVWIEAGEARYPALQARLQRLHVNSVWVHPLRGAFGRAVLVVGHALRWRPDEGDLAAMDQVRRCASLWLARVHAAEQLALAKRASVRAAGVSALTRCSGQLHRRLGDLLTVVQGRTELVQSFLLARGRPREEPAEMLDAARRANGLAMALAGRPALPPPAVPRLTSLRTHRVAVTEADPDVRAFVQQALRGAGHQLVEPGEHADVVVGRPVDGARRVLRLVAPGTPPAADALAKPFGARALVAALQVLAQP